MWRNTKGILFLGVGVSRFLLTSKQGRDEHSCKCHHGNENERRVDHLMPMKRYEYSKEQSSEYKFEHDKNVALSGVERRVS